jgi:hypothetical protein
MAHLKRKRESKTKISEYKTDYLSDNEEKIIEKNIKNEKNTENSKCILLRTILSENNVDQWTGFLAEKIQYFLNKKREYVAKTKETTIHFVFDTNKSELMREVNEWMLNSSLQNHLKFKYFNGLYMEKNFQSAHRWSRKTLEHAQALEIFQQFILLQSTSDLFKNRNLVLYSDYDGKQRRASAQRIFFLILF